jgi:hypothetical protein
MGDWGKEVMKYREVRGLDGMVDLGWVGRE